MNCWNNQDLEITKHLYQCMVTARTDEGGKLIHTAHNGWLDVTVSNGIVADLVKGGYVKDSVQRHGEVSKIDICI